MCAIDVKKDIFELAKTYREKLDKKIQERIHEMKKDDDSHHLIYSILGVSKPYGKKIDTHQNIGRFLYKYAGSFLEEAAFICLKFTFPNAQKVKIPNDLSDAPKTFEIDCLVGKEAFEIKWRDATTDGDHIAKEQKRIRAIKNYGYTPTRIMFYRPNRKQSQKIQERLKNIYQEVGGEYHAGDDAWSYLKEKTQINLKKILEHIVEENTRTEPE